MATHVELDFRPPIDAAALLAFFAARAVPGVEEVAGDTYRRSLPLAGGPATIELRLAEDAVSARLHLTDPADLPAAEAAARLIADLDADPAAVVGALGDDPLLGAAAHADPGLRVPGNPDAAEVAVRAVIGQQVSVAGARTIAGRLVAEHGEPLARAVGAVTHAFPSPAALAAVDPESLPMPRSRGRALTGLAAALADGELVLDRADPAAAHAGLVALPGIGPWTAAYVCMRALGDRDAFLPTDLGVHRGLERLGADGSPKAAATLAASWRPYRAYALHHLWTTLD
jgi:AraC family transcriptional regulator of adaptative response / DNA-3-methyladenine glycosylase II